MNIMMTPTVALAHLITVNQNRFLWLRTHSLLLLYSLHVASFVRRARRVDGRGMLVLPTMCGDDTPAIGSSTRYPFQHARLAG